MTRSGSTLATRSSEWDEPCLAEPRVMAPAVFVGLMRSLPAWFVLIRRPTDSRRTLWKSALVQLPGLPWSGPGLDLLLGQAQVQGLVGIRPRGWNPRGPSRQDQTCSAVEQALEGDSSLKSSE